MIKLRFSLAFLAAVALLSMVFASPFVFADQTDAASAIASAKQEIVSCFDLARQAERIGADISSLTIVLNDAGMLLSDAELAFSKGDFDAALDLAVQCREGLVNFVPEANSLATVAAKGVTWDFLVNVVGSIVGVSVVVAVGMWIWFLMKRRYAGAGEGLRESSEV